MLFDHFCGRNRRHDTCFNPFGMRIHNYHEHVVCGMDRSSQCGYDSRAGKATPTDGVLQQEDMEETPDTPGMISQVVQSVNPCQATRCTHEQAISFC